MNTLGYLLNEIQLELPRPLRMPWNALTIIGHATYKGVRDIALLTLAALVLIAFVIPENAGTQSTPAFSSHTFLVDLRSVLLGTVTMCLVMDVLLRLGRSLIRGEFSLQPTTTCTIPTTRPYLLVLERPLRLGIAVSASVDRTCEPVSIVWRNIREVATECVDDVASRGLTSSRQIIALPAFERLTNLIAAADTEFWVGQSLSAQTMNVNSKCGVRIEIRRIDDPSVLRSISNRGKKTFSISISQFRMQADGIWVGIADPDVDCA